MTWVCEDPDVVELVYWAKRAIPAVIQCGNDGELLFRLEHAISCIDIPEEES